MATYTVSNNVLVGISLAEGETEVTIPEIENIQAIGAFVFTSEIPIEVLTLPQTCREIRDKAFYYNQTLRKLVVKTNLEKISPYAFAGNNPLREIAYNGETGRFRSVNGLLYDNTKTKVILGTNGTSGSIEFADGTTEIGDGAFSYCKRLESVELPSTLMKIGRFAFSDCYRLSTITIPETLTEVSYGAFFGCYNVTLVDISHGVKRLEGLCFGGLPKLRGVDFPNTVDFLETKIGEEPFCGSDRRIVFTLTDEEGSYDEDIKRQLPGDYSGKPVVVTTEVGDIYSEGWTVKFGAPYREVLQAATAAIDSQYGAGTILGWYYDYALTRPIGEEDIVEAVGGHINVYAKTKMCNITLDLCYDGDKDYVLQAPFGYEIVVEDYYTPERKFYNFGGWYADYADGEYSNPKTVDGITRITVMGDATLYAKWVTSSGVYTYEVTDKNEVRLLKVVDWDAVYSPGGIVKIPAYVEMAETELDSEGNPKLDSSGNPIPVRLPVVAIGSKLFEGVEGVKGIVLPNSLRSIGGRAFSNCINLASLDFEEEDGKVPSLATIGARAFEGAAITTLDLPDSVSSIRQGAFLNCQNLESVKFGKKLSDIGTDEGTNRGAFEDCEKLEEVRIDTLAHWNSVDFGFSSCNPLSNGASLYIGESASPVSTLDSTNLKTRITRESTVVVDGKEKTVTTYEEVAATEIKPFAYVGCMGLETVNLLGTVIRKIGEEAFSTCENLGYVVLGNGALTELGRAAFSGVAAMKSLTVPRTLTSIGEYAFNGCTSLGGDLGGADEGILGTLTIEEGIGIISKSMFSNCTALTTVTIPASVREIGDSSFSGCTALTSVTFANYSECTSIGAYAFYRCGSLTEFVLPYLCDVFGVHAFDGCSTISSIKGYNTYVDIASIFSDSRNSIRSIEFSPEMHALNVVLPENLLELSNLSELKIPETVKAVGQIFDNLVFVPDTDPPQIRNGLAQEIKPSGVEGPSYYVVDGFVIKRYGTPTAAIETVDLINTIDVATGASVAIRGVCGEVGVFASKRFLLPASFIFGDNKAFDTDNIPDWDETPYEGKPVFVKITNVDTYAQGTYGDTDISSPIQFGGKLIADGEHIIDEGDEKQRLIIDSQRVSDSAFAGCISVTDLVLKNTVTFVGWWAFGNASHLKTITVEGGGIRFWSSAFEKCTSLGTEGSGIYIKSIAGWCSVNGEGNPLSLVHKLYVYDEATTEYSLLEDLSIPMGVSQIGTFAFAGATCLLTVTIPSTVSVVPEAAFSNCTNLNTVALAEGVKALETHSFSGCSNLSSLNIPDSMEVIEAEALIGCSSLIDTTSLPGMEIVDGWILLLTNDDYTGELNLNIKISGKPIRGIGTGAFLGAQKITSVSIGGDTKTIGADSFNGCPNIESLSIANGVIRIFDRAFQDCTNLTTVDIPNTVTVIGEEAFDGCQKLDEVTIGDESGNGECIIEDNAFNSCGNWKKIFIGESVGEIGDNAFEHTDYDEDNPEIPDTNLTIGSHVIKIGENAFIFGRFTELRIPDSVKTIGYGAFAGNRRLSKAIIGSGIEQLANTLFYRCTQLSEIVFYCQKPESEYVDIFGEVNANCKFYFAPTASGWVDGQEWCGRIFHVLPST